VGADHRAGGRRAGRRTSVRARLGKEGEREDGIAPPGSLVVAVEREARSRWRRLRSVSPIARANRYGWACFHAIPRGGPPNRGRAVCT
jgi:hypothetical protein